MWRRGPPLTPATLPAPFRPKNLGRGLCGDSLRMSLTAVFRPRPCSLGNAPACLLDGVAYVLRDGPGCAYKTQAFLARTGEDGPSETLPAPLSFVFHAECTAHVPSWLPRSPSCELASDCLVAHLLPRQWHSLAACPRHVWVRAGPLLTSGLAMFVARQPIAEVVARLSRGRATTWLFL